MNPTPFLATGLAGVAVAALATALPAQDPGAGVQPGAAAAAARSALTAALRDPELVLSDQPRADGPVWFRGRNYKAVFDAADWSFAPIPTADAEPVEPVRFTLARANVGATALAFGAPARQRGERRIEYRHGDVTEVIDLRGGEVEQSFRFDRLPARGELELTIAVATARAGVDRGDGIAFGNAFGAVAYGEATAIDADGATVPAPTELFDGAIRIRVPAAFVARAALPLVVDPIVQNTAVWGSATRSYGKPDAAFDPTSQTWAVVFVENLNAADKDLFVQRLDLQLAPLGTPLALDLTYDVWQLPQIANLAAYGRFLVVAQVSVDYPAPYWIGGRVFAPGTAPGPQFDIARAGVPGHAAGNNLVPDVGGDPSPFPPTFFTVVWENEYSPTDHDIHMKQVEASGLLRTTYAIAIDNSTAYESAPTISKSNGPPPAADQRWAIGYLRNASLLDEDVRGALLTWDGALVPVGSQYTFIVDYSNDNDLQPAVSSPTDGSDGPRKVMFAYHRASTALGNIAATVTTIDGQLLAQADLTQLEADPARQALRQNTPCVDCDGVRFAVGFTEVVQLANGLDYETRVGLFACDSANAAIVLHDPTAPVVPGQGINGSPAIASIYGGTGLRHLDYCLVDAHDTSQRTEILAHRYSGYDFRGGFFGRATACGSLGAVSGTGIPALGQTFSLTINNGHPLTGFLVGTPQYALPIGPCPGCLVGVMGTPVMANPLIVQVPSANSFFGIMLSLQGFSFGGGPCLGTISLGDTLDFVIQ